MKKILLITALVIGFLAIHKYKKTEDTLPIIAIANYGPHSSLSDSILGIKQELKTQGYIEGKDIIYDIMDVSFDPNLIPQMITKLKTKKPKVMIAMTTPVAQFAKHNIKDIPIIFNVITDPVEANLLKEKHQIDNNATCTSDMQNLDLLLDFAKKLLPKSKKMGVLYSTSEVNDTSLVKMLKKSSTKHDLNLVAIAIDQPRDIPLRMQKFKNNVDFIYVGTSGPIQPTLPTIIAEADKMDIPIFNVNEDAVQKSQVLASFGVNYIQIGRNTGKMVAKLLRNEGMTKPLYPSNAEHRGFISKKQADKYKIQIPENFTNVIIVD